MNTAKIIGVMIGQAVGDALGTRYEFQKTGIAAELVRRDSSNGHLLMLGEGPFGVRPGQVTDDTELAMIVATHFCELSQVGVASIACGFVRWYHSGPFDIGNATHYAFGGISKDLPPQFILEKMLENAHKFNKNSLSNGCLMRASPIALIGIQNSSILDGQILDFATEVCKCSHQNPIAIDAVRVYTLAVRYAIRGGSRAMIWDAAYSEAKTPIVRQILVTSQNIACPSPTVDGDMIEIDSTSQGYLGIALQLAFYELSNGKSFEESLTRTVARGGDADTNACIVGALLGAFYGNDAIPNDWKKTVLNVNNPRVKQLAEINPTGYPEIALKLANYTAFA